MQKLKDLAKDAGLDYVLVISRVSYEYSLEEVLTGRSSAPSCNYNTPTYSFQPQDPSVIYRLTLADGKKELVRGLEFRTISLRTFRDVQAVGADARPYVVEPIDYYTRSIITPSYVIGELELTPVKSTQSSLPVLPGPLSENKNPAASSHYPTSNGNPITPNPGEKSRGN